MATAPHIAIKVGLSRPNLKGSALVSPICHAFRSLHPCRTAVPQRCPPRLALSERHATGMKDVRMQAARHWLLPVTGKRPCKHPALHHSCKDDPDV